MKKLALIVSLIVLSSTSVAFGYVMGSSNLPMFGYPAHSDKAGYRPSRPYSNSGYEASNYRNEVEAYVNRIKEYVDGCDNDVKRINEARQEAISEANSIINEYNQYVKGY